MVGTKQIVVISVCEPLDIPILQTFANANINLTILRIKSIAHPGERSLYSQFRNWYSNKILAKRMTGGNTEEVLHQLSIKSNVKIKIIEHNYLIKNHGVNSKETQHLLESIQPDVIFTSVCPILKPHIFEIPKLCINLHWGILPHFRGADPGFWALLENCPQGIGMTLHLIDKGIDTGAIIAQGSPPQSPDDDEMSLLQKNALIGVKLAQYLVEQLPEAPFKTIKQTEKGKLYFHKQRKFYHDLQLFLLTLFQQRRLPKTDGWIEYYGIQPERKILQSLV